MSDVITETLLEMHFFKTFVDVFKDSYGANFIKILKPSPQQETWIGFDQGWVRTSISTNELFDQLRNAIQSNSSEIENFFLGYFLQFKKVNEVNRGSRYKPEPYVIPYLRSELSLLPNKKTGLSQHETLIKLNSISNTSVCYCCPMIFTLANIMNDPDLDKLRIIDISNAPSGWATNQRHFITFQDKNDYDHIWFSDPVKGESRSIKDWVMGEMTNSLKKLTALEVKNLIEDSLNIIIDIDKSKYEKQKIGDKDLHTYLIPTCFNIIEFNMNNVK